MIRRILMFLACLVLCSANSFAREPKAPPSPASEDPSARVGMIKTVPRPHGYGATTLYAGKFGEAVEMLYFWSAEAEMRGGTEAVYFHRKFSDDKSLVPFKPKPVDYKLENFSRLELMELVVIPKNAPGSLSSLKAIRRAKEIELARTGVQFVIADEKNEFAWPRGTFYVTIQDPYLAVQTYSESAGEFYILTAGYLRDGDFGLSDERTSDYLYAKDRALESLRRHLLPDQAPISDGGFLRRDSKPSSDILADFRQVRLPVVLTLFSGLMLIIGFLPGTSPRARRTRLFGISLLLFTLLTALMGFLTVYIPSCFGGVIWTDTGPPVAIPILLIPWISWVYAIHLKSAHPKRVFISSGCLSVLLTLDIFWGGQRSHAQSVASLAYDSFLVLLVYGFAFGGVFALAFGPVKHREKSR